MFLRLTFGGKRVTKHVDEPFLLLNANHNNAAPPPCITSQFGRIAHFFFSRKILLPIAARNRFSVQIRPEAQLKI